MRQHLYSEFIQFSTPVAMFRAESIANIFSDLCAYTECVKESDVKSDCKYVARLPLLIFMREHVWGAVDYNEVDLEIETIPFRSWGKVPNAPKFIISASKIAEIFAELSKESAFYSNAAARAVRYFMDSGIIVTMYANSYEFSFDE
jgi:hypothetical protein